MARKAAADRALLLARRLPRPLRIIYARPRLFVSIAIGLLALLVMPQAWRLASRLLVAWDISIALYVALAFTIMIDCTPDRIRRQAALQDDGRFLVLALTAGTAFASIAAIILELGAGARAPRELVLAAGTILLSWLAIHTTFALHYAHEYYRGDAAGGLAFPGDDAPDYWDFVYFSFVIGMTAQVSDVGITDKVIRRTAAAHGLVSFLFNTALLALMVNIAAGAI